MKDTAYLILGKNGIHDMRKKKPSLKTGQVAVELTVDVPDTLFERPFPKASLTIPEDMVYQEDIKVYVEEPHDEPE